jgi:hypothetical protein
MNGRIPFYAISWVDFVHNIMKTKEPQYKFELQLLLNHVVISYAVGVHVSGWLQLLLT